MNHAEFVTLVKGLTDEEVRTAGLKIPAQVIAVCLVLATYGDYATGTNIKPAWTTIAKQARVSRTTAHKVRDWLVANEVLVPTGKTAPINGKAGNVTIYRLNTVVHLQWTTVEAREEKQLSIKREQLSISEPQLSIWDSQLSIVDGHNTTLDNTYNTTVNSKNNAPVVADAPTTASELLIKGYEYLGDLEITSFLDFSLIENTLCSVYADANGVARVEEPKSDEICLMGESPAVRWVRLRKHEQEVFERFGVSDRLKFEAVRIYQDERHTLGNGNWEELIIKAGRKAGIAEEKLLAAAW